MVLYGGDAGLDLDGGCGSTVLDPNLTVRVTCHSGDRACHSVDKHAVANDCAHLDRNEVLKAAGDAGCDYAVDHVEVLYK